MLQDIYRYAHRGPQATRDDRAAGDRGLPASMNPWLLWRPDRPRPRQVLSVAELDECRCPELCNRDHANE
jgi:hypothetical protein